MNKIGKFVLVVVVMVVSLFSIHDVYADDTSFFREVNALVTKRYQEVRVSIPKGADPANEIQKALNRSKGNIIPVKVILPAGTIKLNKPLVVYGNTYIKATNKTNLIRIHKGDLLVNGNSGDKFKEYDGNSNIVIEGGIWDVNADEVSDSGVGFSFGHGKNLLIQNTVIKDVSFGHAIDLSGDKNVIIRNNKFLGYKDNTADHSRYYAEAIQIDVMKWNKSFGAFGTYDKTQTGNVRIEHNYFGNSGTRGMQAWGRGVGSHAAVYGKQYYNIQIAENTFDGLKDVAIYGYGWTNTTIQGNVFKNNKNGIIMCIPENPLYTKDKNDVQRGKSEQASGVDIIGNTFDSIKNKGINVTGTKTVNLVNIKIVSNKFKNVPVSKKWSQKYTKNVVFK